MHILDHSFRDLLAGELLEVGHQLVHVFRCVFVLSECAISLEAQRGRQREQSSRLEDPV